ncbi:MAG: DNA repair protein [Sumerlaeia bacterium]
MTLPAPTSPESLGRRFERLAGRRDSLRRALAEKDLQLAELDAYLALEKPVEDALEHLSQTMFSSITRVIEEKLTLALQEVLEQSIALRVTSDYKFGKASIGFHLERDGQKEDILRGTGGSVTNVLSVGLRLFALKTLDEKEHRRFLVLDEQDAWLRPDIVPRFVKIIHEASRGLGFQVLMISHHDDAVFSQYADKIYRFTPRSAGGVSVKEVRREARNPDEEAPS